MTKHNNIQKTKVPLYMWLLLALFAADDVYYWMWNPLFFIPVISILSVLIYIYASNRMPLLVMIGSKIIEVSEKVFKRIGNRF
jgi:hypothetical protein